MSIANAWNVDAVASTPVHPQESNATFPETAAERLVDRPLPTVRSPRPNPHTPDPVWCQTESLALEYGKPRRDLRDVTFRHSGWKPTRDRVFGALTAAAAPPARLERFEQCGCNAWVYQSLDDPARFKTMSAKCHDRFCVPCGNERSRLISVNVRKNLSGKVQRFITLTLRTENESLGLTLPRLIRCFSRLRASKLWRLAVTGGISFLEIKRSATLDRWHCHLHVITEGRYMPKDQLSRVWKRITKGSFIVDIRIVKDPEKTVRYVAKYAAKPINPAHIPDDDLLLEAIQAVSGRRLVITFGSWRGIVLTTPVEDGDWIPVCSLNALLTRGRSGESPAIAILEFLKGDKPCKTRAPPAPTLPF